MPLAPHPTAADTQINTDAVRLTLLAERAELLRTLDDVADDTSTAPTDVTDGFGETEHLVSTERSDVSNRVGALARAALLELDVALARLDAGTYGRCTDCSEPIPAERLEALPAAGTCVTCRSASERLLK